MRPVRAAPAKPFGQLSPSGDARTPINGSAFNEKVRSKEEKNFTLSEGSSLANVKVWWLKVRRNWVGKWQEKNWKFNELKDLFRRPSGGWFCRLPKFEMVPDENQPFWRRTNLFFHAVFMQPRALFKALLPAKSTQNPTAHLTKLISSLPQDSPSINL